MGQRRNLHGARILITGASQGIGRAMALEAARRGAVVLAAARNEPLLAELAAEARSKGLTIHIVQADVTDPAGRAAMVDAAQHHLGGLDVLINNAGIGATGHFADASPQRMRQIFEVNFFGLTETTRVCLPLLKQGRTPAILNISSVAGRRGLPARSDYSASKFAVQGFSEALRSELAKDGIDVLLVNPGLTQTNFSKNMIEQKAKMQLDHLRGMTSEQVASLSLDALARGRNEVTFTLQGRLLLLVNRFFPWFVDMMTRRKVRQLFKEEIEARRAGKLLPVHSLPNNSLPDNPREPAST
ncbi:MAG: SDR family oxidoreductase [Gemmataceae bacterium]